MFLYVYSLDSFIQRYNLTYFDFIATYVGKNCNLAIYDLTWSKIGKIKKQIGVF